MIDETLIALSRWQFAAVAMYHFLFVPLTLQGYHICLSIFSSQLSSPSCIAAPPGSITLAPSSIA